MKMLATVGQPNEYVAMIFKKDDGDASDAIMSAVNAHDDLVASNNELQDQVQQLQRDMEGLLAAGKVLAEDIVHKQGVQDQLVAALKAARASLEHHSDDGTGFRDSMVTADIKDIDAALAAVGAA
jgi:uncharacterized protein YoxC